MREWGERGGEKGVFGGGEWMGGGGRGEVGKSGRV